MIKILNINFNKKIYIIYTYNLYTLIIQISKRFFSRKTDILYKIEYIG